MKMFSSALCATCSAFGFAFSATASDTYVWTADGSTVNSDSSYVKIFDDVGALDYQRAMPAGRAWDAAATMLDSVLTVGSGFTDYIDDLRVSKGALEPSEFIQASARTYVPDGFGILVR